MGTHDGSKRQNVELARGINAIAANSLARSNGRFAAPARASNDARTIAATANNNSSSHNSVQTPASAAPASAKKWYPAEYIPKKLASAKTARNSKKTAKLRASITPGTVLILLSGRFRGKRVVFLKQLRSGTLLVTGPYKVNGVPLRRVNQAFVIATSTKIGLDDVAFPPIDDSYFVKDKPTKSDAETHFFRHNNAAASPATISEQRKHDQRTVDALVLGKLDHEPHLRAYLNAKFTLTKNDRVHELQF